MLDRLWIRLMAAMTLTLVVALGAVALTISRTTSETFVDYVEDVSDARAQRVDSVFRRHYQRGRSWAGVDSVVQLVADLSGQRVLLSDNNGSIIADSQQRLVGQRIPSDWASDPLIVTYQGSQVGSVYLDPLRAEQRLDRLGQSFLEEIRQQLLWAVAAGLLAALIITLLLTRWLTAPLETLTRAVRRMERGDLSQRIDIRVGGELGLLSGSFNRTAAALERAETLRRQMVSDIAHELRTPLTNARGYVEAVQDGVTTADADTLGIIEHELAQLTRLVEDLQELAVVEAGQLTLNRAELDLAALAEIELRGFQPEAEQRGIGLIVDIDRTLPLVETDGVRVGQVLRNLLRNALAYTADGGRIVVTVGRAAGHAVNQAGGPGFHRSARLESEGSPAPVILRVRDSGSGISPEHLPHVFERFYRGDRARARGSAGGHGLGLTISRELVRALGGDISVTSVVGQGTEFSVRIPIRQQAEQEAVMATSVPAHEQQVLAGAVALLRNGVVVAAVMGALAGILNSGLDAAAAGRFAVFVQNVGYAAMLHAFAFGLAGALASLVWIVLGRLTRRGLTLAVQTAWWTSGGILAVGLLAFLQWRRAFEGEEGLSEPQVLFALLLTLSASVALALLARTLLRSSEHPPEAGQRTRALDRPVEQTA